MAAPGSGHYVRVPLRDEAPVSYAGDWVILIFIIWIAACVFALFRHSFLNDVDRPMSPVSRCQESSCPTGMSSYYDYYNNVCHCRITPVYKGER
jgi:hypothetical protein